MFNKCLTWVCDLDFTCWLLQQKVSIKEWFTDMWFVVAMKHLHLTDPLKSVCALCDLSKYVFGQEYFHHHLTYDIIHTIHVFLHQILYVCQISHWLYFSIHCLNKTKRKYLKLRTFSNFFGNALEKVSITSSLSLSTNFSISEFDMAIYITENH